MVDDYFLEREVDMPDVEQNGRLYRHYVNVTAGSQDEMYYQELAAKLEGELLVLSIAVNTIGVRLSGSRAVYFLRKRWEELADRVRTERDEQGTFF